MVWARRSQPTHCDSDAVGRDAVATGSRMCAVLEGAAVG